MNCALPLPNSATNSASTSTSRPASATRMLLQPSAVIVARNDEEDESYPSHSSCWLYRLPSSLSNR